MYCPKVKKIRFRISEFQNHSLINNKITASDPFNFVTVVLHTGHQPQHHPVETEKLQEMWERSKGTTLELH